MRRILAGVARMTSIGGERAVAGAEDQFRFGRHAVDLRQRTVLLEGRPLEIQPKVFDLLVYLIERRDRVVDKRELLDALWPDTVVTEASLTQAVRKLRQVLGDEADCPTVIRTVPRRGFQFIASLEAGPSSTRRPVASAIAVLPFTDMSAGRDQAYFCEGLAEELIDALGHVDGLRVAARSASFQIRDSQTDLHEIGRRLAVGALLEGSVRKSGERLRVTVQLVDVETGYQKWSRRFECEAGDVFAIQDEIAESVATILRGNELSPRERSGLRRKPTASDAYEYFLRGRQSLHRMLRADLEHSRRMFESALEVDAGYAPAWAGLATVHATLYEWFGASDEDLDRADRASRAAMQHAPDLADAQVARGFTLSLYPRYDDARPHFEAAIRINPHLFDAYYYFGRACFAAGDIERSADLFRLAADVRQEDFQSPSLLAQSLRMLGHAEEAGIATREAIARTERVLTLNPGDGRALSLGSLALYEDGQTQRAWQWSTRSLELHPDDMSTLVCATCLRAKAGRKEEALEMIERAFSRGWGKRDWIEHDPDYDILRDDPRFQELLAKLR